jgi:hypothetical protein
MANESNFSLKKLSFIKEDTHGEIQPSPKLYNTGVMGVTLAPSQATEQNTELAQDGQATAMDPGSFSYAGNINMKLKTALFPILLHCVAGKSTALPATVNAWTAATTYLAPANKYVAGQMANHSNGTHTLVVKSVSGTGTSGGTEPDLTAVNPATGVVYKEYDTIIDNQGANQIEWIIRKKLYKHIGTTDQDMQTIGIYTQDYSGQNAGSTFEQYFAGVFINSLQFSKSAGTIVYKYDAPMVAMAYDDNTQSDWQTITPSSEVAIEDKSFSFNDMKVTIGGFEPVNAPEFNLTLNRNATVEDQVAQGAKDYNVPVLTMEGTLKLKFTKEVWQKVYNNPSAEIVITYANRTGDVVKLTFPSVKQMLGTIEKTADKFSLVTIPLSPSGSVTQKTMSYETISSSDWGSL